MYTLDSNPLRKQREMKLEQRPKVRQCPCSGMDPNWPITLGVC